MKESLADYVSRVMKERQLSGQDVARRSHGGITQSSVHRIYSGAVPDMRLSTLAALAKGLGVSPVEIFAVATGTALTPEEMSHSRLAGLDKLYKSLSSQKQKSLGMLIDMVERESRHIAGQAN